MSQDVVSDALNQIMNARKVEKKEVVLKRKSRLFKEKVALKYSYYNNIYKYLNCRKVYINFLLFSFISNNT